MQFVFVKSKVELTSDEIEDIRNKFCETTSVVCDNTQYEWVSSDSKAFFIGKCPNITIYEKYQVFDVNQDNELAFIHGWLKKIDEDCLIDAKQIHNLNGCEDLDGLFLYAKLNSKGNGEINTSLFITNLYYAKSEGKFAISSRISTLSKIFNYTTFNKKHFASHIHYLTTFISYDTLYENIYCIPLGSKIIISDDLILDRTVDVFHNEEFEKRYLEDPKKYWDECYERILSQVRAFSNLGINDKLMIGISGGIDSRLLLSIYHENITSTYTNGPTYSPEVIVGRMCAETLGLTHDIPTVKIAQSSRNLLNSFTQHIFSREFEMSPWDFGEIHYQIIDTITIDGQEFVKTSPFENKVTEEEILDIMEKKFLWRKGIVPDEYLSAMTDEHRNYTIDLLDNLHDIQKFPFMERIMRRGRWAGRVHDFVFDHAFNIYPLLTNTMFTYVYNSSVKSMLNQEFIYEIMSRSTPELLDVPLYNKNYVQKYVPPVENKIPGKINYKFEYLIKYFDYLKQFALENHHIVQDFVPKEFLDSLTLENLVEMKNNNDVSLPQSFYNLLESIILFKTDDFSALKKDLDYDWEVEEDAQNDTYDEDCLKAYVEYNKDIVGLKKEVIQYKNEIKEYKKEIKEYKKDSSKLIRFNFTSFKNKSKKIAKKILRKN